jgi:hypothetical protein
VRAGTAAAFKLPSPASDKNASSDRSGRNLLTTGRGGRVRTPGTIIAALAALMLTASPTAAGGLATASSSAAATTAAPGLLQVTVTIEGSRIYICDGTLTVTDGQQTTTPVIKTCDRRSLAAGASQTFSVSEPATPVGQPGAGAQVNFALTQPGDTPALGIIYGGDCNAKGIVSIRSGQTRSCTVDVYPVAYEQWIGVPKSPRPQAEERTTIVAVTQRIAAADPRRQQPELCKMAFRLGTVSEAGAITGGGPEVSACAQGDKAAQMTSVASQQILRVTTSRRARLGITDTSSMNGWVTSYSDGCLALKGGGAEVHSSQRLLVDSCTITHTLADNSTSATTRDVGLVSIEAQQIGGSAPTLCGYSIVATASRQPVTKPVSLCSEAARRSDGSRLKASQLTLAVPVGQLGFNVEPTSGPAPANQTAFRFAGSCLDRSFSVKKGLDVPCTLDLYPIDETILIPGTSGGPRVDRLVSITELLPDAADAVGVTALCKTRLVFEDAGSRIGSGGGAGGPHVSSGNICREPLGRQTVTAAGVTVIRNFLVPVVAGTALAVSDNFTGHGYVTTYDSGCSPNGDGFARFALDQRVDACTFTHSHPTDVSTAGADGTVTVVASSASSAFSVCDSKLVATATKGGAGTGTGKQLAEAKASCSSATTLMGKAAGPSQPDQAIFTLGLPVGRAQLTLTPLSRSHAAGDLVVIGGGQCDGTTIVIEKHVNKNCTLTAYVADDAVNLGGSRTRLIQITDSVAGIGSGQPTGRTDGTVCKDSFGIGTLDRGDKFIAQSKLFSACAQGKRPVQVDGTWSTTTVLAVRLPESGSLGLQDDFAVAGFVTTYGDGCALMGAGQSPKVVTFVDRPGIATCTITHTLPSPVTKPTTPTPTTPTPTTPTPTTPQPPAPQPLTSSTSLSCPASAQVQDSYSCTATVTLPANAGTASGTVTFAPSGATCVLQNGSCSATIAAGTTAATATVTASYPGAGTTIGASSASTTLAVTLRATSVAISCSSAGNDPGNAVAGATIDCVLTVQDSEQPAAFSTAGGSISATAGSDTEQCTLASTGSCMVSFVGGLPAGSQTITASYAGDGSEFAASTGSEPMHILPGG